MDFKRYLQPRYRKGARLQTFELFRLDRGHPDKVACLRNPNSKPSMLTLCRSSNTNSPDTITLGRLLEAVAKVPAPKPNPEKALGMSIKIAPSVPAEFVHDTLVAKPAADMEADQA
ncbi:hypothetical protein PF008_g768 [Phytophthora fragariae]|uniref:Uncharacterized protein n=1 Tax=Phytophthora fragariae TaxID=53985 RepID=A0A6G0SM16_9STRA|nr:hypothetical protein PF008_g768 [Phytophthora fragariae]